MTKVYVSATFRDLEECRSAVRVALRRLRVDDVSLDTFVPEDRRPVERCLNEVAECDIYVGIFGWRYGFVPYGYNRSITELEYRQAQALGKPCLIFLVDEEAPWPRVHVDRGQEAERIEAFRTELLDRHLCGTFTGPADLAALVTAAVANMLRSLGQAPDPPRAIPAEAIKRYYDWLHQRYATVDIEILTPLAIYAVDVLHLGLASAWVEPTVLLEGAPAAPARLLDVLTAPERRKVVLLGTAGSGKSTAGRYLALSLATTTTPADERLAALHDHLPVLIELRSYAALAAEGRCDTFLDYLDNLATSDGMGLPRALLEDYLDNGGEAVVVFDGLDEIFDRPQRSAVAAQIANFATRYAHVRVVVTARTHDHTRRTLDVAGFTAAVIEDLDDERIEDFLTSWYRIVGHARPVEGQALLEWMPTVVSQSPSIRELAGNPMMLTILAIVGRHQALPRERWKFFDHAASVLIEQWDVGRHLSGGGDDLDSIDGEDKKEMLRRLAYRLQSAGPDRVAGMAAAEVSEIFEDYIVERYRQEPGRARAIALTMIRQLNERNHILSRTDRGYGFAYRAFQEFFAAEAIASRFAAGEWPFDRLAQLYIDNWPDESWHEVLRLVAGALPERLAASLVDVLLDQSDPAWPTGSTREPDSVGLAAQCLGEIRSRYLDAAAPAERLLRRLIMLLEVSGPADDDEIIDRLDRQVLPSAREVGPAWPGAALYLGWYRRRGHRSTVGRAAVVAARLAAVLAGPSPAQHIEEIFDGLGALGDFDAARAAVAGLAETSQAAARSGGRRQLVGRRTRELLIAVARDGRHGSVRREAVEALAKWFGDDVRIRDILLERATVDGHPLVRLAAVERLTRQYRGDSSVNRLIRDRMRQDADVGVRRAAVRATDRLVIDDTLHAALQHVVDADPAWEVVDEAGRALLDRGAAAVLGNLVTRVGGQDDLVGRAAARLFAEHAGSDETVVETLTGWLDNHGDGGVVATAARALIARYRTVPATDGLIRRLSDADETVRAAALAALSPMADQQADVRSAVTDVARNDPAPAIRGTAMRAIARRMRPDATALLIAATRDDGDPEVRVEAVRALADAGRATVDLLASLVRTDPHPLVRAAAADRIGQRYAESAAVRDVLVAAAHDPAETVRASAVAQLAAQSADRAIAGHLLESLRDDGSPRVFEAAAEVLIGDPELQVPAVAAVLRRASTDQGHYIRAAAVALLGRCCGTEPEVVAALLGRVEHDPDEVVFNLAIELTVGVAPAQVRDLLVRRADGDDPFIRVHAVVALATWFATDPDARRLVIQRAGHALPPAARVAVLAGLGPLAGDHPAVYGLVVDELAAGPWVVRQAALAVISTALPAARARELILTYARAYRADPVLSRLAGARLLLLPGVRVEDLPGLDHEPEPAGADPVGGETAGSFLPATEPPAAEPEGTEPAATDPAGGEPAGTDREPVVVVAPPAAVVSGAPATVPPPGVRTVVAPQRARHLLHEVFKQTGTPTLTFVEPPDFAGLRAALDQPGLGIIVEGPSGIGKTTMLQHCVRLERGRGSKIDVLSARRPSDVPRILELPVRPHRGIVAIDDFHRLSEQDRADLTDYLKLLADEESQDRRLIIVGIPGTGESLVELAPDIASRINVFRMPKVSDDLIRTMIRQGEEALNITFGEADRVVEIANGSFNVAQMVCHHLAHLHAVDQTQETAHTVDRGFAEAVTQVEKMLAVKYRSVVEGFAALDGEKARVCIELLLMLPECGGILALDRIAEGQPELARDVGRHFLDRFPAGLGPAGQRIADHLYLDVQARRLIVEDPQLLLYLSQQSRDALAAAAGKRNPAERDQVFVSYSHYDGEWLRRLHRHLKPLEMRGKIDVWADTRLEPGDDWKAEILAALDRARVGILLVTADFLASPFIHDVELRALLASAQRDGCQIWPLIVSPTLFSELTELSRFQAFNKVAQPLSGLTYHEQEKVLSELAAAALRLFNPDH